MIAEAARRAAARKAENAPRDAEEAKTSFPGRKEEEEMPNSESTERLIARLEASGYSPHAREAAEGVIRVGGALAPPSRGNENHLRIVAPSGAVIGVLTPGRFVFYREADRERLLRLDGAVLRQSGKVTFSHRDGAGAGLAAVQALMANAV